MLHVSLKLLAERASPRGPSTPTSNRNRICSPNCSRSGLSKLAGRVLAEIAGMNPSDAAGKGGEAIATWMVDDPGWSLLVLEFGVLAGRDPQIAQAYLRERRHLRSQLVELIGERAREWGVDDSFDVRTTAISLMALISGLVLEHSVDPEEVDQSVMGAAVTALFAGAVARAGLSAV